MNLTFWLFFFWFSFVMLCLLFVVTFALVIAWLRMFGQRSATILLLHLSIMAQRMFGGFLVYELQLCWLFFVLLLVFTFAVVILSVTCSVIHIQFGKHEKGAPHDKSATLQRSQKQIPPPSSCSVDSMSKIELIREIHKNQSIQLFVWFLIHFFVEKMMVAGVFVAVRICMGAMATRTLSKVMWK